MIVIEPALEDSHDPDKNEDLDFLDFSVASRLQDYHDTATCLL